VNILKLGLGSVSLNGEAVKIPRKLHKTVGIMIRRQDGAINVVPLVKK